MKLQSKEFTHAPSPTGSWLCIRFPQAERLVSELKDGKTYDIDITEHREKRSLNANAMAWAMLDKLAEKMSCNGFVTNKVELYKAIIPDIPGVSDIVCVQNEAVDKVRKGWESKGIGWLTDTLDSKIPGCTNVVLYYGSSCYDTHQMHLLIDRVIEECKTQGVEVLPPEELARLEGY